MAPAVAIVEVVLSLLILLASLRLRIGRACSGVISAAIAGSVAVRVRRERLPASGVRGVIGRSRRKLPIIAPIVPSGVEILRISIAIRIGLGLRLGVQRALGRAPAATMRTSTFGHAKCGVRWGAWAMDTAAPCRIADSPDVMS
jgi:hypothetical protein